MNQAPVNPIPPAILVVFLALLAVEAVFLIGQSDFAGPRGIGWRLVGMQDYAFSPQVMSYLARGQWDFDLLKRFVTYPFVHGAPIHAVFAAVFWIALGKYVAEAMSGWAALVIGASAAVGAALVYGLIGHAFGWRAPLLGAYPMDYGLIGAFTYINWVMLGRVGQNQLQAFRLIAMLMGLQLFFGLVFGGDATWVADVAGFLIGGAIAPFVAPGGWQAFLARIRNRS